MVKSKYGHYLLLMVIAGILLIIYQNSFIVIGDWTKQTIFLWLTNSFHMKGKETEPKVLLVDDDGGNGIFALKKLCDELHLKATFAVIPSTMNDEIKDSLRNWQKIGYGIALHGYNHDDWREWTYDNIKDDIIKSKQWLASAGFDTTLIKYVVAPKGSNTRDVRKAIRGSGYQMITGANILNPNTEVFQLGRVMITKDTDLEKTKIWLNKAKKRNLFVILGTHSSMPEEFSEEKIKAVLQMAINMGFEYQH